MDTTTLIYITAVLFFFVAFAYASVGLGGGSSYTALMAILGYGTAVIPMVSLMLNLAVTAIGSINFIRHKHGSFRLVWPFLATSMPMAYLGGAIALPKIIFYGLLIGSLIFVAIRIYFWSNTSFKLRFSSPARIAVSLFAGAVLGFLAGTVGIGGGIFLVPLIIVLGLGNNKEAAACGTVFIFLNSLFGLVARLQYQAIDLKLYIPLLLAVVLGGFLGSWLGATRLSPKLMEKVLGAVIVVAIVALGRKFYLEIMT